MANWLREQGQTEERPPITLMWVAAKCDRVDVMKWLMAHGASPDVRTRARVAHAAVSAWVIEHRRANILMWMLGVGKEERKEDHTMKWRK